MTKKKLERFAEIAAFTNVLQPGFFEVFEKNHPIKGKWRDVFFENDFPLVIELGCGKGEYTVGLAKKYSQKNFVGIDIKGARIWRGAKTAIDEDIKNVMFLRTRIEFISSFFEKDEVDEIWLTFPDPQPKKKRKRLTSGRFLNRYKLFLKPEGFLHLKTDSRVLYEFTINLAVHNGLPVLSATDDLYHSDLISDELQIKTFYEKGFLEQGLRIFYMKFKLSGCEMIKEPPEDEGRSFF
ncbi:MAG TPA: tRNA (guanosine(46)-N7)-methyltransferase TrmB [Bacteroidales bacterium]|nr:tRNA (guanosine(46)-N7)-methyltransferase TrmB [Bacteroidales bacterium]